MVEVNQEELRKLEEEEGKRQGEDKDAVKIVPESVAIAGNAALLNDIRLDLPTLRENNISITFYIDKDNKNYVSPSYQPGSFHPSVHLNCYAATVARKVTKVSSSYCVRWTSRNSSLKVPLNLQRGYLSKEL